jgi:hypothetical protein
MVSYILFHTYLTARNLLILKLHSNWDDMFPLTPCPINFTEEEVEAFVREYKNWNGFTHWWKSHDCRVRTDGRILPENYQNVKEFMAAIKEAALANLVTNGLIAEAEMFDKATKWAVTVE